jgi:hypothetical protein
VRRRETATREVVGRLGIDKVLYEEKEQVAARRCA